MNFSQKFGMFCLIIITILYVYFAYFNNGGFEKFNSNIPYDVPQNNIKESDIGDIQPVEENSVKKIKIFVTDSNGNLRSVYRNCSTIKYSSCFDFAIKELISGPSKWEKSRGLSSEIPSDTKILSIREGAKNIFIDLSPSFESGGGAENTYIRVRQLIKTANANTKLPVYLYINGKQADVIGGEGIMLKQPLNERSLDE